MPYHQHPPKNLVAAIPGAMFLAALVTACGASHSSSEIAEAYSDILIVSTQYRNDSTELRRVVDSVTRHYGYNGPDEFWEELYDVANDPDQLRIVLDSTARKIEAATR